MLGLLSGIAQAEDTFFTSYHFMGAGNCARCHNGLADNMGNDVSIETAWSSTMMANSSKDPLWRAKVRSEIDRNPHLEEVISDKCTKCHAPMANKEAHFSGDVVEVFDDGFLDASNSHHDEALNGVSCTLCHQIKDNGTLGTLSGMSGNYEVDESRTIYGPYSDVFPGPMRNNIDYDIHYSDHIKDSKLCATCHNLKTPYVDENGNVLSTTPESEFPEQMPYSEWEHSDYADTQSCQDCHMQRTDGVVMASRPPWLAAAIEFVNRSLQDGVLEISLNVHSNTGHKLPTSFPSRRAFMHFKVTDGAGNVVFESGRVNADGSIEGADADSDPAAFEPHYDVITAESQVQIYETIMQNNLGEVTYTLLRGMGYKKDNRILPKGFDKASAHSDIRVHGAAEADDDFVGGSDTITYRIGGLEDGSYTVEAELLYQTLSFAFAQDLFREASSEAASFKTMFDASAMKTSQIAAASLTVSGSGSVAPAACDDGIDNDGDGLVDLEDPGCTDVSDNNEFNEAAPLPAACEDGIDNDGDGLVDLSDPGCTDASDSDEYNEPLPECSDGIDNDGDGKINLADASCSDASDNDETYPKKHRGGH
ncbi:MAG: multiheme c-type cytochrome [Campylobacterales bacterium]